MGVLKCFSGLKVGLTPGTDTILNLSPLLTVVYKKFVSVSDTSAVNLIV